MQDGYCRNDTSSGVRVASYVNVTEGDESALQSAVAIGPVAIAIDAAHPEFEFYATGVYYNAECKNGFNDLITVRPASVFVFALAVCDTYRLCVCVSVQRCSLLATAPTRTVRTTGSCRTAGRTSLLSVCLFLTVCSALFVRWLSPFDLAVD